VSSWPTSTSRARQSRSAISALGSSSPALGDSLATTPGADPLVSVVIPCYNQARFLVDSIESSLGQTHRPIEVIVIDDGSSDDTSVVAAQYPEVRYLRQENRGLPATRNRGLDEVRGDFVVFLDADDRLLPNAVAQGLAAIGQSMGCAFAVGHYRSITETGAVFIEAAPSGLGNDPYATMLERNVVGTTASAIFRTALLRAAGGFRCGTRFWGCEDYELYLRLSRQFAVARHVDVIAEYRIHSASMSHNRFRMMSSVVATLESQRAVIGKAANRREALDRGLRAWRSLFVPTLLAELVARRRQLGIGEVCRRLLTMLWLAPRELAWYATAIRRSRPATFRVSETEDPTAQGRIEPLGDRREISLQPAATRTGRHFNLQPCGMSALAVDLIGAKPQSVVVFGETPLLTTYGGPTRLTALVPAELYSTSGEFSVYVIEFHAGHPARGMPREAADRTASGPRGQAEGR
jgi:glycosyltransferase involved in cell wall biosynthesis